MESYIGWDGLLHEGPRPPEEYHHLIYKCPTCGGTYAGGTKEARLLYQRLRAEEKELRKEDQMENKISAIHHIVGIGEGAGELENIVEVKIEHGSDIFNPKEPDPIKVGDEVEYMGFLDYGYETGIVEEIRIASYINFENAKEYRIDGEWFLGRNYLIHKKVNEEDIVWGTVEEVISGGMNSVNEKHNPSVLRTPEEIIEGVKKFIEKANQTVVSPPLNNIKIEKIGRDNSRKHQTTMEEDFLSVLLED